MSVLSDILSVPALLLFHATWLLHSLRRPLLLVSALCVLSNPPAAIRKLRLFRLSVLYLIFCRDKKWKVPANKDPASFFPEELGGSNDGRGRAPINASNATYREKTVILIRHGESTWNDTFNAGDRNKLVFVLFFVPNLLYAALVETYYFVSGRDSDSWFFDSPLSAKGVNQGEGLRKFLKKEKMRLGSGRKNASSIVGGEERAVRSLLALGEEGDPSSVVCSSNLRRAISTAVVGLADRFVATNKGGNEERLVLIPSLQEISRNPDALSILPPRGVSSPTWCDDDVPGLEGAFSGLVNPAFHTGNKSLESDGLLRMEEFCGNVFDPTKLPKSTVIATGHSLFFRSMFRVYLPRSTEHVSKEKKLVNGGTVSLTLREATLGNGRKEYMIDPRSLVVVYGGFGKHKKG
mmetsp:Transcript_13533/g.32781  ORF Transcript_13533/g.32781 Transcript_13533/m.32781 type:complete len:407 (+) Transcript_13533:174-1394(+)